MWAKPWGLGCLPLTAAASGMALDDTAVGKLATAQLNLGLYVTCFFAARRRLGQLRALQAGERALSLTLGFRVEGLGFRV